LKLWLETMHYCLQTVEVSEDKGRKRAAEDGITDCLGSAQGCESLRPKAATEAATVTRAVLQVRGSNTVDSDRALTRLTRIGQPELIVVLLFLRQLV
jgi:hypothetical protein